MSKPKKILIENYDYSLPDERIAKYPLTDRDASKLLLYRPGVGTETIDHKQFSQVPELLEEGDRLYFNATRVVQARLVFRKPTGARIEIFCLEPHMPADYQLAFSSTQPVEFICLVGNAKKWKEGKLRKFLESKETYERTCNELKEYRQISKKELDKTDEEHGEFERNIDRNVSKTKDFRSDVSKTTRKNGIKKEDGNGTNEKLKKGENQIILTAEITGRQDDKYIVRFSWDNPATSFGEILECSGSTPIPPYLNREADDRDATTYQTVYARKDGSVAAPTAGLHFTKKVLGALDQKGVNRHELILHVGAGTFIPVKEKNAVNHQMHAELVTVDRSLLESLLSGDRKIAVGTTTTRSLESIYWLGVKAISSVTFSFDNLFLDQWDAYEMGASDRAEKGEQAVTAEMKDRSPLDGTVRSSMEKMEGSVPLEKAVRTLLTKMDQAGTDAFSFHTRLMITPGYRFRVIGGLFTNFHQPKSTLLLLIAAVAGDDWRRIYEYALENDFRFLSYGDGSLLFL